MRIYPRGFFSLILLTFALLAVSGALFAVPHLAERFSFYAPLALPEGVLMKLHGAAALVSGLSLLALNGVLLITAWGLFYLGDEVWRQWTSDIHLIAGLVLIGVMAPHLVHARTLQAAR
jgi:hypothetical protein